MKYLAGFLLLIALPALSAPRLFVFDCGTVQLDSLEMFDIRAEESDERELFIPCYMIRHGDGILVWDGGLPREIADNDGPISAEGSTLRYDRWFMDQLADMGVAPEAITHVAFSHLHFDHVGAANDLAGATVLMQRDEWESAFDEGQEFVDSRLFEGLRDAKLEMIDGDHDVFGDGSVRIIHTPGHTPGHQSLLVMLRDTGPVMLSGDLYHTRANRELRRVPVFNHDAGQTLESMDRLEQLLTETGATLWIGHDKALADTLKKAPAYYE